MQKTIETTPDEASGALSRRDVLKTAAASLVLLIPISAAVADPTKDQWTSVGKSEDFLKDQPTKVTLTDGSVLYITRKTADTVVAVSAKCTHRGCELGWNAADVQLQCPCHGAAFASTGKNIHGTRRDPDDLLPDLVSPATRQKDGQVQVNLAV